MNPIKLMAIVLIALGAVGLAYGGFSYTRETHTSQIGPLELTVKDQRTVGIPVWAGLCAIVVGAGLLLISPKQLAAFRQS